MRETGHAMIEDAVARVQGLEEALAKIARLLDRGMGCDPDDVEAARQIVDSCVKYSRDFNAADPGEHPMQARVERTMTRRGRVRGRRISADRRTKARVTRRMRSERRAEATDAEG